MAYRLLQTMCKMNNQILLDPRHRPTMAKSKLYHNIVNGSASELPIHSLQTRWLQFVSNASKEFGKRFYMNDGAWPANAENTVVYGYHYNICIFDGKRGGSLVAMVVGAALCYYAYSKIAYHEIGWQEFVVFYLSKGQVAKLEVVNKEWVRVLLHSGQSVYSKTLWFNIGSVDSFERNLESAQRDLGFERLKFVPVEYKEEMGTPSTWGVLPTILIVCGIICILQNC